MADKQKTLQRVSQALALLAAASSGPLLSLETSVNPGEVATELETIIVTPQINPLDESMQRLRKMLEDPTCKGCGPLIEVDRQSVYEKTYYGVGAVLSFLSGMPEKPPDATPEERAEGRIANDWRRYERDPER